MKGFSLTLVLCVYVAATLGTYHLLIIYYVFLSPLLAATQCTVGMMLTVTSPCYLGADVNVDEAVIAALVNFTGYTLTVRNSFKLTSPGGIVGPGKILFYEKLHFITLYNSGILNIGTATASAKTVGINGTVLGLVSLFIYSDDTQISKETVITTVSNVPGLGAGANAR
jgi:hypothetical protein